jgi:dihydrofolate reductase
MNQKPTRKLIASEWVSLDGVFDADTMETWFNPYQTEERNELIKSMIFNADDLLLGRVTYEMLASYWPKQKNNEMGIADRLNTMPKHVVSTTLTKGEWASSTFISNNVAEQVMTLKEKPGKNIMTFGSATLVDFLLQRNLLDEVWLLVQPIVMAKGKRAFKDGLPTTKLKLAKSRALTSGVLALTYEVVR